ncbi:Tar ligand binding domain-containing protein, partial [Rhodoferax sp.]|uniref:Tar ligand binding domain-containing protein n=1 Tax=Rhodoferax sp. TaxID=50421 RepID=UPI002620F2CD
MNHLKISTRLGFLIFLTAALMLVIGGIGLNGMRLADDSLDTIYTDHTVGLAQLNEIEFNALRNRLTLSNAARDPQPDRIKKYATRVEANIPETDALMKKFMQGNLGDEDLRLGTAYAAALQKYAQDGLVPTMAALKANDIAQANQLLDKATGVLYDQVHEVGLQLIALQLKDGKAAFDEAVQRYERYKLFGLLILLTGVLLAVGLGVQLMRTIQAALQRIAAVSDAIAQGNLTEAVASQGSNELATVMHAMHAMQTHLAHVVQQVRQGSENVATASAEIAQGNQDLSNRTESQASALEQTAASMEELSSTVKQNADNARQANQL